MLLFNNFAKQIIKTQNLLLSVEITFVVLRVWYLLSEDPFQISDAILAVYHQASTETHYVLVS